jgi:glutathione S-transferase
VIDLTEAVFGAADGELEFVMPEGMSVADILLTTCMNSALGRDIPLCDRLMRYHARITARPAYRQALERNRPG